MKAPVLLLSLLPVLAGSLALPQAPPADSAAGALEDFIAAYDRAFNAKDLGRLAELYHPEVTIFEGGHVNTGWVDYRDNHLGPELREMQDLEFAHGKLVPHVLAEGVAYLTAEYRIKARVGGKAVDAEGLETLILVRPPGGGWKIRHSHTSARRKPAAAASPPNHKD